MKAKKLSSLMLLKILLKSCIRRKQVYTKSSVIPVKREQIEYNDLEIIYPERNTK